MKYLFCALLLALSTLAVSDVSKAQAATKTSSISQQDNPVQKKYRQIEFLSATSIICIGGILGTGRSIKYFKGPKQ